MTKETVEYAAALVKAGTGYSGADLSEALDAALSAVIVTYDEAGGYSANLIDAFDAACAMAHNRT